MQAEEVDSWTDILKLSFLSTLALQIQLITSAWLEWRVHSPNNRELVGYTPCRVVSQK